MPLLETLFCSQFFYIPACRRTRIASPAELVIGTGRALGVRMAAPNLRVGNWVMDTTPVASGAQAQPYAQPHAYFYRVVGITETGASSMDLEVQTPLRSFTPGQVTNGTLVVMDGVAEVFEKGTGWHP